MFLEEEPRVRQKKEYRKDCSEKNRMIDAENRIAGISGIYENLKI
jgi:hypothetical protein